jgi:hypothetical protein
MSLKKFNSHLRKRILLFLWRQWTLLGLSSSSSESGDGWVIDPEALLLFSANIARWDPRLYDEVMDWMKANANFINMPRLKSLLRRFEFSSLRSISAMSATVSRHNKRLNWQIDSFDKDAEPIPLFQIGADHLPTGYGQEDRIFRDHGYIRGRVNLRGMSSRFNPVLPESVILRLRALVGITARAEIIAYLCTHKSGHPRQIALETGYSQKNVQDTLVDMAASQYIQTVQTRGRRKIYFILPETQEDLLLKPEKPPRWVVWPHIFRALEIMWMKLHQLEIGQFSPLMLASEIRELKRLVQPLAERGGSPDAFSSETAFPGEKYPPIFFQDADRWLSKILNEKQPTENLQLSGKE